MSEYMTVPYIIGFVLGVLLIFGSVAVATYPGLALGLRAGLGKLWLGIVWLLKAALYLISKLFKLLGYLSEKFRLAAAWISANEKRWLFFLAFVALTLFTIFALGNIVDLWSRLRVVFEVTFASK